MNFLNKYGVYYLYEGGDIMKFTLYGVMGSMPGGQSNLGKNSTCLVINDETSLIIDGGTGLYNYLNGNNELEHSILFTHYHLDHILGLPFVSKPFNEDEIFNLYGPTFDGYSVSNVLDSLLVKPLLPINKEEIKATINFFDIEAKKKYEINGFKVDTLAVNHPGGCMVYKITKNGKVITVLTDLPNLSELDRDIFDFCKGSDLIYADGTFLQAEIKEFGDFGHSSIESVIRLFNISGSKKLVIGHHKQDRLLEELLVYQTKDVIIGVEGTTFDV